MAGLSGGIRTHELQLQGYPCTRLTFTQIGILTQRLYLILDFLSISLVSLLFTVDRLMGCVLPTVPLAAGAAGMILLVKSVPHFPIDRNFVLVNILHVHLHLVRLVGTTGFEPACEIYSRPPRPVVHP